MDALAAMQTATARRAAAGPPQTVIIKQMREAAKAAPDREAQETADGEIVEKVSPVIEMSLRKGIFKEVPPDMDMFAFIGRAIPEL